MSHLVYILPALACPLGMVLMMAFMGKGMKRKDARKPAEAEDSLEDLRTRHDQLSEQIERLERERLERRRLAHR